MLLCGMTHSEQSSKDLRCQRQANHCGQCVCSYEHRDEAEYHHKVRKDVPMNAHIVYIIFNSGSKEVYKVFSTREKAIKFVNDNNNDEIEGDEGYYQLGLSFEVE